MTGYRVEVGRHGLAYAAEPSAPVAFADLLAGLNERQRAVPMAALLASAGALVGLAGLFTFGAVAGGIGLLAAMVAGFWIGGRWDRRRRIGLSYSLDREADDAYAALLKAFDALAACSATWYIEAGDEVDDVRTWKRSGGASQLLDRRPAQVSRALPRILVSDVTPPMIELDRLALYFLPDVILAIEGSMVGAIAYDGLGVRWHDTKFVEDGAVPGDAVVVARGWKHPNRQGGPDRRFADNRELPVCVYETVRLSSDNGLDIWLQVSRTGLAGPLWDAIQSMVWTIGNTSPGLALPRLGERQI